MINNRNFATVLAASALLAGVSAFSGATAQQDTEYVPKVIAKTLHDAPLPGAEGKVMIVKHFAIPPGYVGGKHYHPGPVYVYVLEGVLDVETESGKVSIGQGELYPEELNSVMQARNLSTENDLEILVFQVGDVGKPMMVKAD